MRGFTILLVALVVILLPSCGGVWTPSTGSSQLPSQALPSPSNTSILQFPDEVARGDYITVKIKTAVAGRCHLRMGEAGDGGWLTSIESDCVTDQDNIALFHVLIPQTLKPGAYFVQILIEPWEQLEPNPTSTWGPTGKPVYIVVGRNIVVKATY